jgi:biotin transport system substrate-specific component
MAHADSPMISFVDALWPAHGASRTLRAVALAVLGSAFLTLSAKVQVPIHPVPMTMQTLVVLPIGMAFGFRLGLKAALAVVLAAGGAAMVRKRLGA